MDKDYSKRELDMKFQDLEDKIDENHDEIIDKFSINERANHDRQQNMFGMLEEIKAQTTKHNGRMTKVETRNESLAIAGSVAIFLGSVIVGLVIYIYQYQLSQQSARITNLKATIQMLQSK